MEKDASQMLKNWCQSNHFILTKHINICQSNALLQVYSFHFKSTNEGIETVVTDKHEFQDRSW